MLPPHHLQPYHLTTGDLITSPPVRNRPYTYGHKKSVSYCLRLSCQSGLRITFTEDKQQHSRHYPIYTAEGATYIQTMHVSVCCYHLSSINQSCEVRLARDDILKRFPKSICTEGCGRSTGSPGLQVFRCARGAKITKGLRFTNIQAGNCFTRPLQKYGLLCLPP